MKWKAQVVATAAVLFVTVGPALAQRPWGDKVGGRDPYVVWERIRENPEVSEIRNVLEDYTVWELNGVQTGSNKWDTDNTAFQLQAVDGGYKVNLAQRGS